MKEIIIYSIAYKYYKVYIINIIIFALFTYLVSIWRLYFDISISLLSLSYIETTVEQWHASDRNVIIARSIPTCDNKLFTFSRSINKTKHRVELRHSTRNVLKTGRKVRNGVSLSCSQITSKPRTRIHIIFSFNQIR